MPENKSVSAWEKQVKSYASSLGVLVQKSQVQKMAKRFHRLEAVGSVTEEQAFEMFKRFVYGDPVGEAAVKNVMNENAVRRIKQKELVAA